jgi:hypothetical protein
LIYIPMMNRLSHQPEGSRMGGMRGFEVEEQL